MKIEDYLNRVPSQHRDRPKFRATLETSLAPFVQLGQLMESVPSLYDVDTAVFLSYLYGSELALALARLPHRFLSYLYGSEHSPM